MKVRAAGSEDFAAVHALLAAFGNAVPPLDGAAGQARFDELLAQPGTVVFLAEDADGTPLATATLHVLANLTHGGRPYALVENVLTARERRGQGLGRRVMQALIDAAWAADAYKIMLLTGQGAGAQGFYARLGFDAKEKQAMTLRRTPVRPPQG